MLCAFKNCNRPTNQSTLTRAVRESIGYGEAYPNTAVRSQHHSTCQLFPSSMTRVDEGEISEELLRSIPGNAPTEVKGAPRSVPYQDVLGGLPVGRSWLTYAVFVTISCRSRPALVGRVF